MVSYVPIGHTWRSKVYDCERSEKTVNFIEDVGDQEGLAKSRVTLHTGNRRRINGATLLATLIQRFFIENRGF